MVSSSRGSRPASALLVPQLHCSILGPASGYVPQDQGMDDKVLVGFCGGRHGSPVCAACADPSGSRGQRHLVFVVGWIHDEHESALRRCDSEVPSCVLPPYLRVRDGRSSPCASHRGAPSRDPIRVPPRRTDRLCGALRDLWYLALCSPSSVQADVSTGPASTDSRSLSHRSGQTGRSTVTVLLAGCVCPTGEPIVPSVRFPVHRVLWVAIVDEYRILAVAVSTVTPRVLLCTVSAAEQVKAGQGSSLGRCEHFRSGGVCDVACVLVSVRDPGTVVPERHASSCSRVSGWIRGRSDRVVTSTWTHD
mmetsp:Transcript_2250/g.4277  ORF Transcript_2250/g.4277 Transcript_2250/m.4277 type:complete len:306 (+) Transcript_2250:1369-2286(+)